MRIKAVFLTRCLPLLLPALSLIGGIQAASAAPRLHFARGYSRLVVRGFLSPVHSSRAYAFYSRAGRRLAIALKDSGRPGHSLVSMYHITFPDGKAFGMKGYDPFDGRLTETGVYSITVEVNQMASEARSGFYTLTLTRR